MNNAFSRTAISAVVLALAIFPASASSSGMQGKKPLPIHHGGRVVVGESNNLPTYTYSWPGVYFEAAFAGTEVDVRLDDSNNILNLIIDGQAPVVLARPGKKTYSINNLTEGEHRIRLEKRTETQFYTDIIVIALGGNDFATPLNPDERWKTREALQDDFVEKHESFILSLREKHPGAHLVLLSYDPINKELENQVTRVVEKLKMKGEDRVDLVGIRPTTLSACQWHPSEADHRDAADILIRHIEANPALWD